MADKEQPPNTSRYMVQLRTSSRPAQRKDEPRVGTAWEVTRFEDQEEGKWPDYETLLVSLDVFDSEEDAKRNVVQTLHSLRCYADSPIRIALQTAIAWIVDEI